MGRPSPGKMIAPTSPPTIDPSALSWLQARLATVQGVCHPAVSRVEVTVSWPPCAVTSRVENLAPAGHGFDINYFGARKGTFVDGRVYVPILPVRRESRVEVGAESWVHACVVYVSLPPPTVILAIRPGTCPVHATPFSVEGNGDKPSASRTLGSGGACG